MAIAAKKLQILKHGYSKHKVKPVAKKICVQSLLRVTIKQSHQFGIWQSEHEYCQYLLSLSYGVE